MSCLDNDAVTPVKDLSLSLSSESDKMQLNRLCACAASVTSRISPSYAISKATASFSWRTCASSNPCLRTANRFL
jgi:hypothetical protein